MAGILITTKAPGKSRFQNQIEKLEDEVMVLKANSEIKESEIEKLESKLLELKKKSITQWTTSHIEYHGKMLESYSQT